MSSFRVTLAMSVCVVGGAVFPGPVGAESQGRATVVRDPYRTARDAMVQQIESMGLRDSATLAAMRVVPRHAFVRPTEREVAYGDYPLPIAHGQTISQPFIVAYMTAKLDLSPGMKVLEIGTGSGYQAAVLATLGCDVYTIEIVEELAQEARARLDSLGYQRVHVRHGDGYLGWPAKAPFDRIIVTAAPDTIPERLVQQLRPGGRMVLPIGPAFSIQALTLLTKDEKGEILIQPELPVRFVPMIRER